MAQYKVPQDVEADDKLLGPFTFRQFIYLLVCAGLGFLAYGLAQIFPALALIPIPFILFLLLLALPIKKDQPMETYLAALFSFYLKPRKRFWNPGQRESTILITAPKKIEENRTRDISGAEASHRLSFLANIVDSEGRAIKTNADSPMREDFVAEAASTTDMFENAASANLDRIIESEAANRRNQLVTQMRASFKKDREEAEATSPQYHSGTVIARPSEEKKTTPPPAPTPSNHPATIQPRPIQKPSAPAPEPTPKVNNNQDVFISLR